MPKTLAAKKKSVTKKSVAKKSVTKKKVTSGKGVERSESSRSAQYFSPTSADLRQQTNAIIGGIVDGLIEQAGFTSDPQRPPSDPAEFEALGDTFKQLRDRFAADTATTLVGLTGGDLASIAKELDRPIPEVQALLRPTLERVKAAAKDVNGDVKTIAKRLRMSESIVRGFLALAAQ